MKAGLRLPGIFFILLLVATGCTSRYVERKVSDLPTGPSFEPGNISGLESLPTDFRRVVLLPFHVEAGIDVGGEEMARFCTNELRNLGRFEVVEVTPELLFRTIGVESLSSQDPIPEPLLAFLEEAYAPDGVFQVDLTQYRPYPPFVIGIRSRLFSLPKRELIWAGNEVFDAGTKSVHNGARRFALSHLHSKHPYGDSYSALRSPKRYLSYVSQTLFETLPEHP